MTRALDPISDPGQSRLDARHSQPESRRGFQLEPRGAAARGQLFRALPVLHPVRLSGGARWRQVEDHPLPAVGRGQRNAGQVHWKPEGPWAFVTDTIRLRKDLTLTAGLRWEGQINPQPTAPNPKFPITSQIPNDLKMW